MKLLEYEAKSILRSYGLRVPKSTVITKDITDYSSISLPTVLKSQVPIGGRGKLGGVVIIEQEDQLKNSIDHLFSLDIKGLKPSTILSEEKITIQKEHYLCLLVDRSLEGVRVIAHKDGGIEVEENDSENLFNRPIDTATLNECSEELARFLGYELSLVQPLLTKLYQAFVESDAVLLEINPLIYTDKNELVCGDCKMELDDAATFRHPEWDFEDKLINSNFVVLNSKGNVATIANGAGLAMATVDAVADQKMIPANFLDIGGGANMASILQAFENIMQFENIQVIVINIFAGITRCDEVAKAIIGAKQQIKNLPPLFIRLAGTNFEEAVALLSKENITTLSTLEECLTAAKEVVHE